MPPQLPQFPARVHAAFVLLFAVTPDAAVAPGSQPLGLQAIPDEITESYHGRLDAMQQRLLGEPYLRTRRLTRTAVGRLVLHGPAGDPPHADIHLVIHKSGAAVWEVWLTAPTQTLDADRWIGWLDLEREGSIAHRVWRTLNSPGPGHPTYPEMMLPLAVLRAEDLALGELVALHGYDLVKLLHRDDTGERFKAKFVSDELAADFCRREEGLSLLARNGAIDVHGCMPGSDSVELPHNTLPLLVTLELLCLERAVLRSFLNRFRQGIYGTVEDLMQLRRDIFDGLEEYYGTLAKTHGYTAEATTLGERLFGINDLFDAVGERLEALTFEITTRNQQAVSRIGMWLTTSFGAIETGFVAASIATWYYRTNLLAVLGWTFGVAIGTAFLISRVLRSRMKV
ncbi:MAG: hypothetical protein H7332_12470 [Bdellovibrionales bacterium]|nr:hypothetical protein [Ramlibacter sp.]